MPEPNRAIPNKDSDDPIRPKVRIDKEDPNCRKSSTDNVAPIRANPLSDIELPKFDTSKTDSENTDPTLIIPQMESDEPMRMKLRRDKAEP
jgi:hypothetical protein